MHDWWFLEGELPMPFAEYLADLAGVSKDSEYDDIVNAAFQQFFRFYTPKRISNTMAVELEKFVLNYFILKRIGKVDKKKWKQVFRNKWMTIIPYYEKILETEENESRYITDPILNGKTKTEVTSEGTLDQDEQNARNTDTEFQTTRNQTHAGTGTHNTEEATTGNGTTSQNASSTEVNRYSDTPQGNVSSIWEVDSHGHPALGNKYLTDIRGITNSSTGSGTSSDTGSLDRDETTSDNYTHADTGKDVTDQDETGSRSVDQDTTGHSVTEYTGFTGTSPSKLLEEYRLTFQRTFENIALEMNECFYNLVEIDDFV